MSELRQTCLMFMRRRSSVPSSIRKSKSISEDNLVRGLAPYKPVCLFTRPSDGITRIVILEMHLMSICLQPCQRWKLVLFYTPILHLFK